MPLYDIDCPACGYQEDVVCPPDQRHTCPECGQAASMVPIMPRHVGIIWDNKEVSTQLGRTFNSNKEKRDYLRTHPHVQEVSKGSSDDKRLRHKIRERAENIAVQRGFRSNHEYVSHIRKETDRQKELGHVERPKPRTAPQ